MKDFLIQIQSTQRDLHNLPKFQARRTMRGFDWLINNFETDHNAIHHVSHGAHAHTTHYRIHK
jgi:hypothetical protein